MNALPKYLAQGGAPVPGTPADGVVLVTGATGFIGRGLLPLLVARGRAVRAITRGDCPQGAGAAGVDWQRASGLDAELPLAGCRELVHLAARVHVMNERTADPLGAFRQVNVAPTEQLARRAATAGVRRFVYLSTAKVNGEETLPGRPFTAEDEPHPEDAYGISKYEAEIALRRVAQETGMEVVIIRPPLVYGPGVKGNFQTMIGWLRRGIPLPLASLDNRRSLVGLANLCDLIVTCLEHPGAADQAFLVSDGHDLSTTELLRLVGEAMERPARLWSMPPSLLVLGAKMLGRPGIAQRLCGSLQLDIAKTKDMLGWSPPVDVQTGVRRIFETGGQ